MSASDRAILAMELLEGEDLQAHVRQKERIDAAELLEIFDPLCDALGEAHERGIVHRDLKPENIFLAKPRRRGARFTVKVLDFGIARKVAAGDDSSLHTEGVIGTPFFMAPEQASPGHPIGPPADVWALGLIAFHLLTGRHFWRTPDGGGGSLLMWMKEAFVDPLSTASERAAEWGVSEALPPGFDAWFSRCLRREPGERYAGATEVFEDLAKMMADIAPGAVRPGVHAERSVALPRAASFEAPTLVAIEPEIPTEQSPFPALALVSSPPRAHFAEPRGASSEPPPFVPVVRAAEIAPARRRPEGASVETRNAAQSFMSTSRGQIMVVLHNAKAPTDADWKAYVDGLRGIDLSTTRSIVFTEGGAPNTAQRNEVNRVLKGVTVPGVVISPSAVVRGVVTALSWFNPGIKAYSPEHLGDAFRYLVLTPDEITRVWDVLDALRARLGNPPLSVIPPRR